MPDKPLDHAEQELLALICQLHDEAGPIKRSTLSVVGRGRGMEVARSLRGLKALGLAEEFERRPSWFKWLLGARTQIMVRPLAAAQPEPSPQSTPQPTAAAAVPVAAAQPPEPSPTWSEPQPLTVSALQEPSSGLAAPAVEPVVTAAALPEPPPPAAEPAPEPEPEVAFAPAPAEPAPLAPPAPAPSPTWSEPQPLTVSALQEPSPGLAAPAVEPVVTAAALAEPPPPAAEPAPEPEPEVAFAPAPAEPAPLAPPTPAPDQVQPALAAPAPAAAPAREPQPRVRPRPVPQGYADEIGGQPIAYQPPPQAADLPEEMLDGMRDWLTTLGMEMTIAGEALIAARMAKGASAGEALMQLVLFAFGHAARFDIASSNPAAQEDLQDYARAVLTELERLRDAGEIEPGRFEEDRASIQTLSDNSMDRASVVDRLFMDPIGGAAPPALLPEELRGIEEDEED